MTPISCATDVAKFLQDKFDSMGYRSTDKNLGDKPMHVFPGFLPKAMTDKEKAAMDPCIVIRPVKFNDLDEESTVELQLLFCTYNRSMDNGFLELYYAMECCRQWLCQEPVINRKYRINMPMESGIPEEQPFPEWLGYIKVSYTIGRPVIPIEKILEDEKRVRDYLNKED